MPEVPIPPDRERDKEQQVKVFLREDPRFAAARIALFQYLIPATAVFLLSGYWNIQIRDQDYWADMAQRNYIRSQPLPAPRGKILDREGRVIVDNHSSFNLMLSRENLRSDHIQSICRGLEINCDDLQDRLRRFDRTRAQYEAITIKEELNSAQLAFVEAHGGHDTFPELEIIHAYRRLYPRDGIAAHLVGYTGEISEGELNLTDFASYKQGDIIGKAGVERQYNDTLMGVDGQRRVIVNSRNKIIRVIDHKEPTAGRNLRLTIDLDLQVVAELAMEDRRGAVVALDPRNGNVLAMVSRPAYDPNKFAGRIRSQDWEEIRDDPEYPMMNRAIQAQLAPGSTFKPIVALAGLAEGAIDDSTSARCTGGATYYDRFFKCNVKNGHGWVTLHRAIAQSCNIFFHNAGMRLDIDRIAQYADMAGLGKKTGIDLPSESEGTVPSRRWVIRTLRRKWYAGETISVAIGQGAVTVTPLQMAHAIGGLAMGGEWHKPHLLLDPPHPRDPPRKASLHPEHVAKVVAGMCAVVNEGGTAARARLPGIEMCGKTGSAQLISNELAKSKKRDQTPVDNAWFVGFAPRHNPEIVVAALYEAGEHGDRAAPIVRDVIKAYFDKKRRSAEPVTLAPSGAGPAPAAPSAP